VKRVVLADELRRVRPDVDIGAITAGRVIVDGVVLTNPQSRVVRGCSIVVEETKELRGSAKLRFAFDHFGVDVSGKVALDVGAAAGGFTTVLLERGAAKVYAGARSPASLDAVRERLGEQVVPVRLDVTSAEDRRAVAGTCQDVELLVSNAGLSPSGPVLGTDETVSRETFEVNVFGPMALVEELVPALRAHRGGILFVNSVTGLVVSRSSPVYGASKAAVRMLALALRQELRADGVVVTTSHPGFIDTDMASAVPYPKATPAEVVDRSLAAWEAEATVAFPDRLAELVEQALSERAPAVLTEPQQVMTGLVADLQATVPSPPA